MNNNAIIKSDPLETEERLATRLEKKMGGLFKTQTEHLEIKMGELRSEIVKAVDHVMEKRFDAMGTRVDAMGIKVDAMGTRVDTMGIKVDAMGTKVDDLQKSFHVLHQSFMNHDGKVIEEVRRETAKHVTALHAVK